MSFALTSEQLAEWRREFYDEPCNVLAQNVCTTHDPYKMCLKHASTELPAPAPNKHAVPGEGKATSGGPAWISTGLDLLRLEFAKSFKSLPADFEFSAGYLLYWHKLERCNYLLHEAAQLLMRCEPVDGRKFRYLMHHVAPDGGNWQMFVNLVKKYGVMPKQCYQTTGRVHHLNVMLSSKLREFVSVLHNRFIFDGDGSALPGLIAEMMPQLYKVLNIVLGEPPQEFKWTYYDSKRSYQCLEHLSGPSFYEELLKGEPKLDEMLCLGHDPRLSAGYAHNYEVELSSNMVGGRLQRYNNQPMDVLLPIVVASLAGGRAVWLVHDLKTQTESEKLSEFPLLFGLEVGKGLTKAERMLYKETKRNRVLLLTQVSLDAEQEPLEFRTMAPSSSALGGSLSTVLANLQGEDIKSRLLKPKTALRIKTEALREYAFEIVVHSSFVPPDVLGAATRKETKELPPWDIMGSFLD
ncbi:bleomycin hydrolase [Drosophila madeirensis]|uniref:Bleomycin hydrolase n=1 Tax=Drosophila madeirensis TaxID=30013 RepID=A0AAU9GF41_DROMD